MVLVATTSENNQQEQRSPIIDEIKHIRHETGKEDVKEGPTRGESRRRPEISKLREDALAA